MIKERDFYKVCVIAFAVLIALALYGHFCAVRGEEQTPSWWFKRGLPVSELALAGATVSDWHSTGNLRELNPILGQNRRTRAMIMGGSTVGVILINRFLQKNRKTAIIINFVAAGLHGGATVWNYNQRRHLQ